MSHPVLLHRRPPHRPHPVVVRRPHARTVRHRAKVALARIALAYPVRAPWPLEA